MSAPPIDVLLATWNGERYLPAQLASLDVQTYPAIRFLARDDGSTDATPRLLEAWRAANPQRVVLVRDGLGKLGAAGNFGALLEASTAPYAMFCDQDDVWDRDKASLTLAAMVDAERAAPGAPVLAHTDLRLIDGQGRTIAPSAWARQRMRASRRPSLAAALAHNDGVTGCAAMINRPLAALARPLPAGVVMHDWYLLILAAAFGVRAPVRRATLSYRLHGGNAVGLASADAAYAGRLWRRSRGEGVFARARAQAETVRAAHRARLDPRQRATIDAFIALPALSWCDRRRSLQKHGFWKGDVVRDAALLALL